MISIHTKLYLKFRYSIFRLAESDSSLDDWVDTLPQVLTTTRTKFESNIVMQIMLTLAKQRNPTFVQSYARDQHAVRGKRILQ